MIRTKLTRTDVVFSRATSAVFFCAGFWIFRYAGKIPKKIYKKSAFRKLPQVQRGATGQPRGSQEGAWRGPAPGRATCPPGLVPRPPVLYFGPIYCPDAETPEQKSLFQSTSRSRRNPLFFSGRANLEAALASGEGKSSPSPSSSPLHHPSMTSPSMCE